MKRMVMVLAGLALVFGFFALMTNAPERVVASTNSSSIQDARLDTFTRYAPPPKAKFTRTTYAATDLDGSTALIDSCKGPIAVGLGAQRPTLIAEHDYCGGASWISKVKVGDAVQIGGEGVGDGIFVVTSLTYETRNEVTVGDLPDADAVLQTCVSASQLVLVGLERFEPAILT